MKFFVFCLLLTLSFAGFSLGNSKTGQSKAQICSACHGADGVSTNPLWPNLAGQHATYLLQQLHAYQEGPIRPSPIMEPLVAALTRQDMEDLAAFYAQKKPAPANPLATSKARGEQLYRQGDIALHVPACISCHGPDGRGAEQAGFPMISHQNAEYIVQQLQAFKAGTRRTDPMQIMRTISTKLSAQDIQELAEYIAGL